MSALSNLKANADDKKDETLRVVAEQLESVFLEMVLKSMHEANASLKSEMFDRDQEDFYQGMFDKQLALSLSKSGGVGIADVIYKQLKPKEINSQPIMQERLQRTDIDKRVIKVPLKELPASETSEIALQHSEEQEIIDVTPLKHVQEFVETLLPHAKVAAKIIGIDPKVLLAQSALETGWGKHIAQHETGVSSHNLFGIKSDKKWDGDRILSQTLEYVDNQAQKIKASFKSYDSYLESFIDYVNLVKNKRYEKALENTQDPKAYLTELHQAGYATDPNYVDKIMAIYEKFSAEKAID